jgi:RND family efflux transporter MFP subunit
MEKVQDDRHIKPPDGERPPRARAGFGLYTLPAVLLAVFGGLVYMRVEARNHNKAELAAATNESASAVPVSITRPSKANPNQDLTLPGDVQAFVETPVYARTNGYLKRWYFDIGARVKTGDLLATIDAPEVDEQLRQAEAAQVQAEANLDLAKTTAERWQNLLKSDSVSQQDVDQNNGAFRARQADVAAANANVQRLKDLQGFEQVTAPFSGVLTARSVDIGALIAAGNGKELFRLAQIDTLRVYVHVPEAFANDMRVGTKAELQIAEYPNRTFAGAVARASGAIDAASRTLLTEVDVPNPKNELMPGAYAQVTFHLHHDQSPLAVPANALVFRSAGPQVVIVDGANTARFRNVTIGRDLGSSLEIASGLTANDRVVVNPPDSLADGTLLAIERAPDSH